MQEQPHWDDLAYFSAVAREGSLAKGAAAAGTSVATLSRRLRAFETRIGRRLFEHGTAGYTLTADGRALADKVARMDLVAAEIGLWRAEATGPACVRISAGTWTALDLAENVNAFWTPDARWLPEFVHCDLPMDLARGEIDIGLRNARPTSDRLAGRRVRDVRFAVYARGPHVRGWIGLARDAVDTPSSRWVRAHARDIVTKANTPQIACALARAGLGRIVLPTFIGDRMDQLERLGGPIEDLDSEQWLVCHHEGRHAPHVRAALEALADYLSGTGA